MKNWLCTPSGHRIASFPTYYEAVVSGQQTRGYANFTIETPNRVPTREEQLLQEPPSQEKKRKAILESI